MKRTAIALLLLLGACAPNRGEGFAKAMAEADRATNAGRFDQAADRFADAAAHAKVPRDALFARYEAAIARAKAGDVARASRELHALADTTPPNEYSAEALFKAADLAERSDPAVGLAEMEAMALRFPASPMAKVALARILRNDDDRAALARLERLLPRVQRSPLEEDVTYERGKRLAALGRTEAARDVFLDVAGRWPYPKGAYFDDSLFRAAECEEKLGRPREAIADLERLLSFRESSTMIGSYERPRYVPAILEIAKIYEDKLNDRAHAREALHRLYADFKTSVMRDDALWREADLWKKDGDNDAACGRLSTLVDDFPDSRYVPCAIERCPSLKRSAKSKAPKTCHPYLTRDPATRTASD